MDMYLKNFIILSFLVASPLVFATPSTYVRSVSVDGLGFSQVKCMSSKYDGYEKKIRVPVRPSQMESYLAHLAENSDNFISTSKFIVNKKTKKAELLKYDSFLCEKIKAAKVIRYAKESDCADDHNDSGLTYLGNKLSQKVIMFGKNTIKAVDDEDIEQDNGIDEDLKAIIRRVVQVKTPDGFMGSAFLTGRNCNKIVTAKHNFYNNDENGKKYASGDHHALRDNASIKIMNLKSSIGSWKVKDEGIILDLAQPVKGVSCPKVPLIKRADLKQFKNCVLVGYPSEIALKNGEPESTGKSMVKKRNGELYDFGKRGMSTCSIKRISRGNIIHNCSSSQGSSGGIIACKVNGAWSYVGTNDGGVCTVSKKANQSDTMDYEHCYNKDVGPEYQANKKGLVYGNAGSFEEDFQ